MKKFLIAIALVLTACEAQLTDEQLIEVARRDVQEMHEHVQVKALRERGPKHPDKASCYKIVDKKHIANECRFYSEQGSMLVSFGRESYDYYIIVNQHVDKCLFSDRFLKEDQIKPVPCPKSFVE